MTDNHEHPLVRLAEEGDDEGVLDVTAAMRANAGQRRMEMQELVEAAEVERLHEVISEAIRDQ
jgi:predicted regulator of Ras-like GTPase activity (Roadblock/LC7/MglB family)